MWTTCKKTRQSLGKQKKHWVKEEERMKFFYTIVNLSNIKLGLTKTNASEIISKIISKVYDKAISFRQTKKKKTHFPPRQVPTILRKRTKLKGKLILLKNKIIKRITKKVKL